jgi:hypothetical protein
VIHQDKVVFRKAVEDECALGGMTAEEALAFSVRHSDFNYCIKYDGKPLAYFGWKDECVLTGGCKMWMLSTEELDNHKFFAARASIYYLDKILETHYSIECIVDPAYEQTRRWLEWLGFREAGPYDRFVTYRITRGGRA